VSKPENQFYLTIGEAPTDKISLLNIWIGGILSDERPWFFPASAQQRQDFAWNRPERYDRLSTAADSYLERRALPASLVPVQRVAELAVRDIQLELPFEELAVAVAA